jgi:hypothetical protein
MTDPPHRATIAQSGPQRIWNEPETGGEAYIPLARSKRPRSEKILFEVARRFDIPLVPRSPAMQRVVTHPTTSNAMSFTNNGISFASKSNANFTKRGDTTTNISKQSVKKATASKLGINSPTSQAVFKKAVEHTNISKVDRSVAVNKATLNAEGQMVQHFAGGGINSGYGSFGKLAFVDGKQMYVIRYNDGSMTASPGPYDPFDKGRQPKPTDPKIYVYPGAQPVTELPKPSVPGETIRTKAHHHRVQKIPMPKPDPPPDNRHPLQQLQDYMVKHLQGNKLVYTSIERRDEAIEEFRRNNIPVQQQLDGGAFIMWGTRPIYFQKNHEFMRFGGTGSYLNAAFKRAVLDITSQPGTPQSQKQAALNDLKTHFGRAGHVAQYIVDWEWARGKKGADKKLIDAEIGRLVQELIMLMPDAQPWKAGQRRPEYARQPFDVAEKFAGPPPDERIANKPSIIGPQGTTINLKYTPINHIGPGVDSDMVNQANDQNRKSLVAELNTALKARA